MYGMQIKGVVAGAVGTLAVVAGAFTAVAVANADETGPREPVAVEKTVAPTSEPTVEPTAEPLVAAPAPVVEEVPVTVVPEPETQPVAPAQQTAEAQAPAVDSDATGSYPTNAPTVPQVVEPGQVMPPPPAGTYYVPPPLP